MNGEVEGGGMEEWGEGKRREDGRWKREGDREGERGEKECVCGGGGGETVGKRGKREGEREKGGEKGWR